MQKRVQIEDALLRDAKQACGARTDVEAAHLGLEALVRHAAYQQLAALRGSERSKPNARKTIRKSLVLADTSIWLRACIKKEPYATELQTLLVRQELLGHEMVYGKILVGDKGGGRKILRGYENLRMAKTLAHDKVVAIVEKHKLQNRGVAWIEIHVLASALESGFQVWTADPRFAELAHELGVAYNPPRR